MVSVGNVMVPAWAKWAGLAAGLALLVSALAWLNVRYFINPAVNAETARWKSRWDQRDRADLQADYAAQQAREATQRENQNAIDQIQKDAQMENDRLNANLRAAGAKSLQLQRGIEAAIASLAGRPDTGAASGRAAGKSATGVLTELYREIDAAAGHYAAEADRARLAGLTCEAAYNQIRNSRLK